MTDDLTPSTSRPICPDCGGPLDIRNPTGACDHLYWTPSSHGLSAAAAGKSREVELLEALEAAERADKIHSNCEECMEYGQAAEVCEKCYPSADDARLKRRAVLAAIKKSNRAQKGPGVRISTLRPSEGRWIVTDEQKRELRTLARLAWNNWPDTPESRQSLEEQERKALAANDAWDRVVSAIVTAIRGDAP